MQELGLWQDFAQERQAIQINNVNAHMRKEGHAHDPDDPRIQLDLPYMRDPPPRVPFLEGFPVKPTGLRPQNPEERSREASERFMELYEMCLHPVQDALEPIRARKLPYPYLHARPQFYIKGRLGAPQRS